MRQVARKKVYDQKLNEWMEAADVQTTDAYKEIHLGDLLQLRNK